MITYTLSLILRHQHLWKIQLKFDQKEKETITVSLPNWVPGSYMIRNFSKHIIQIQAKHENQIVPIIQTTKNSWILEPLVGEIEIEYIVYSFDSSIRGSYLDNNRGFFDGASILLSVNGSECKTHQIIINSLPDSWQVATNMPVCGNLQYQAKSYQECIDYPFELGQFEILEFEIKNIKHQIILSGYYFDFDKNRLVKDIISICQEQIKFFDSAPFNSYLFLLHVKNNAYGGLEHRNSCALLISKECLPQINTPKDDENYTSLLGLFSHEYFHAWNIKTIKPDIFQPYDLTQESYTEQLWAFEGITSFYEDLFLLKAEVITPEKYLTLVAKNINDVYQQKGHQTQSLAQSSFNAWTKYYQQDENNWNAITSYYKKGALAAFCLDIYLRNKSCNLYSLDSVMKFLYQDYLIHQKGIAEKAWETKIAEFTGINLTNFFKDFIYGTEYLKLKECFQSIGIEFFFLSSQETQTIVTEIPKVSKQIYFGAKYIQTNKGLEIQQILNDSNAEKAGLNPNDVIIAINYFSFHNFKNIWANISAQDTVIIHFFRDQFLSSTTFCVEDIQLKQSYFIINNYVKFESWFKTDFKHNLILN